jgi:sec-independent protein translocase protein TatC
MDDKKGGDSSPDRKDQPVSTEYPEDPFIEVPASKAVVPVTAAGGGRGAPPPPPPDDEEEPDNGEDGMLRMSFLQHLEELRSRLIKALAGFGIAFVACIGFSNELWKVVSAPAFDALQKIGIKDGHLTIIDPMEGFMVIWFKLPLVASLFVGCPWVLYQIWAFIAPGLYKRERRWAVPFVVTTAGLFISGGCFAYFVAFRYGLAFLLGIELGGGVVPMVSVTTYFDLFVNVILGVALVFELPVVIFFLTLLRIASPRWLLAHSRYAILAIVILAAIVTPTPDVFNMTLFAVPMILLYFVGLFASYLLILNREGRKFPWKQFLPWIGLLVVVLLGIAFFALRHYHVHFLTHWPFLTR